MNLMVLNGYDLYYAFVSGARKIISKRHYLNQINVFPVPDGDTGSNMAYLMETIIHQSKPSEDLSETLESIANAALVGSRGNSGIIFAEYINGIYEKLKGKATATLKDFHHAVIHGIQKAYQAIMNPIEGTILTVLRKAFDIHIVTTDFTSYFKQCVAQSIVALKQTTQELEVLKRNNVVDAGAQGLTEFLEGITHYLETGEKEVVYLADDSDTQSIEVTHEMVITERYCTEALLKDVRISSDQMREAFMTDGSSLIVSGRQEKMRLHIHTDYPANVFLKLRQYGQVIDQKVDDMIRQEQAISLSHPKIAIVTDTIADIPMDIRDQFHIHLLPANLLVDGTSYLDKVTITTETFYELLSKAKSFSSSQPDKVMIERNLEFLEDYYDHILVITVASKLSGTYNAIYQYAKTHPKVHVFDSKQNSGAQGLVVYEAAKKINEGLAIDEVMNHLHSFTTRTRIYVSVKTLKYMVRQGRVKKVTGIVAKIMNLKPVISLDADGGGIIKRKAFSLHKNVQQILELAKQAPVESYAIVHALAPERAQKLADQMENITGLKPLYTTMITPIVAMNAGIGAIAVAITFTKEVE